MDFLVSFGNNISIVVVTVSSVHSIFERQFVIDVETCRKLFPGRKLMKHLFAFREVESSPEGRKRASVTFRRQLKTTSTLC